MIPIIDIFAGPGGLGEGFASFRKRGGRVFHVARSFEKDDFAHATLRFRAFVRNSGSAYTALREQFVRGLVDWQGIKTAAPAAAAKAEDEARRLTLGHATTREVRNLIGATVGNRESWLLIGGPPCQAYSLVGRARNRGVAGYSPEKDERQTLYVEYLQILADHAPPVFVMENVKGLLSAELQSQRLFERIRADLRSPAAAVRREGRSVRRLEPEYEIFALAGRRDFFGDDPGDFVVRCEQFGIPQRRHRVIILGIRRDVVPATLPVLKGANGPPTVAEVIGDLARLRSGLSRALDSPDAWKQSLRRIRNGSWIKACDGHTRARIVDTLEQLSVPRAGRGADVLENGSERATLNHSSRSHIERDLERYMFASAYARAHGKSPRLDQFPGELLPEHANVDKHSGKAVFADRFRVQVAAEPATTITAHISKDGHYYIHPDPSQCRSLTVREAARLQTFPDDYFFCGPRTAQYQQVGNAVPPALATRIAGVVAEVLGA